MELVQVELDTTPRKTPTEATEALPTVSVFTLPPVGPVGPGAIGSEEGG